MGDAHGDGELNETPLHKVNLSSFYLGKYEVTQKEYKALIGKNPSNFTSDENLPVEKITWWDAIRFCNALSKKQGLPVAYKENSGELLTESGEITTDLQRVKGYRLPTEAEWEYAAKGGNKQSYCDPIKRCKYSGSDNISNVSWFSANANMKTNQIGKKDPNELGIYDLSGNVSEWVHDFYGNYSSEEETNPLGSISGSKRSFRRGCWGCYMRDSRASSRSGFNPDSSDSGLGFRIARSAN